MVQFKCGHWGYVEANSPLAGARAGERAKEVKCSECDAVRGKRRVAVQDKAAKAVEVPISELERGIDQ